MKMWSSYKVFSSRIYRLITLVLFPLFFLIGEGVLLALVPGDGFAYGFQLLSYAVVTYEVIIDYWFLGGICSLEGCHLESLKLSVTGASVLQKATRFDLLRRFVYLALFGGVGYVCTKSPQVIAIVLSGYIAIVVVLNVTRYMSGILLQLSMSQVAAALMILILFCISEFTWENTMDGNIVKKLLLLLVLALGVSAVMVPHIQNRWKESYYEK